MRLWNGRIRMLGCHLGMLAALALSSPATAVVPGGGGDTATDCFSTFDGVPSETVSCQDGCECDADGAADGTCTFQVSLCLNQPDVAGCTPAPLKRVKVKPKRLGPTPPADLTAAGCGAAKAVPVKLKKRGKRAGTKKIRVVAKSQDRQTDKDLLTLTCTPSTGSCDETPPCPPGTSCCPPNASGADQPNEVILTVQAAGTDLANGWKGPTMNFPSPANTSLSICLSNCDATDPECDAEIITGPDTPNRTTFGPPLPLFTAGVPVCVVNEFAATRFSGGVVNLQTGAIDGPLNLISRLFLTSSGQVCPKCVNNRCDSGPNQGGACQIDGTVTVAESTAANKTFDLSKDCPPPTNLPAGVLNIKLPLTTGTSCVRIEPHPVSGEPVCIDVKGGISQQCCSSPTGRACQPTRGGGVIERTGKPDPPQPPWPGPTYPKTANVVLVATFCARATGEASVDGLTGLPGALMLPARACVTRPGVPCPP